MGPPQASCSGLGGSRWVPPLSPLAATPTEQCSPTHPTAPRGLQFRDELADVSEAARLHGNSAGRGRHQPTCSCCWRTKSKEALTHVLL